jgi:hypothetical protein
MLTSFLSNRKEMDRSPLELLGTIVLLSFGPSLLEHLKQTIAITFLKKKLEIERRERRLLIGLL